MMMAQMFLFFFCRAVAFFTLCPIDEGDSFAETPSPLQCASYGPLFFMFLAVSSLLVSLFPRCIENLGT